MRDAPAPGIYGMAPGVDFARALARGLRALAPADAPEALARVTLYLNSARMLRAVQAALAAAGPGFLPRMLTVSAAAEDPLLALPPAVPALRRRLELAVLVARAIERAPDLAPAAAVHDLAESLAALLDEMEGEAVPPERIAALDVADHAAHWARARAFLSIVAPLFAAGDGAEARLRQAGAALVALWADLPPAGPVIVAGSTGSRGATAALMRAVAALPQGYLVLPGVDFDLPPAAWAALDNPLTGEDHPQFRFARLLAQLGRSPEDIRPWPGAAAPDPARNAVLSLALRPAPVTDRWRAEGPGLPDLDAAMARVALLEAPSPRAEAASIALALRDAAAAGRSATLVTPDRGLARQVAAALDRWGIRPDDSAGLPLGQSAPGRLLRMVARLAAERPTAEALLAALKHPLSATGADRGAHLLHTRALELRLRRRGPPWPTGEALRGWAAAHRPAAAGWADWAGAWLDAAAAMRTAPPRPLAEALADLRALAEALAAGPGAAGAGALWAEEAGAEALALLDALAGEAAHGGATGAQGLADLIETLLAGGAVRAAALPDPRVRIVGTVEARVGGAGLVILGGLAEGTWPAAPAADPWLNRPMRHAAGLLLPERRIGLAAHDFQQAAGAPEVILSRPLRDAEAETTPARWLNRLTNLLAGLPERAGPAALAAMRARGAALVARAALLDVPQAELPRARRPAPQPPVADRPDRLPVTAITTLIRDPYAVYARHILRLYPLDPLRAEPDARLRGTVLHAVLAAFARDRPAREGRAAAGARLAATAARVLAARVAFPAARVLWAARIARATDAILDLDEALPGAALVIEEEHALPLPGADFTLTARPDRIDRLADGRLHVIDFKSGTPPTLKAVEHFEKQLLLEAAMARAGAFTGRPEDVAQATYLGLAGAGRSVVLPTGPAALDAALAELARLIAAWRVRGRGYTARRAMARTADRSEYDHLARRGEWSEADPPDPRPVGEK